MFPSVGMARPVCRAFIKEDDGAVRRGLTRRAETIASGLARPARAPPRDLIAARPRRGHRRHSDRPGPFGASSCRSVDEGPSRRALTLAHRCYHGAGGGVFVIARAPEGWSVDAARPRLRNDRSQKTFRTLRLRDRPRGSRYAR